MLLSSIHANERIDTMRYSSWLTLAFSASAIARPEGIVDRIGRLAVRDVQDVANLPAIKGVVETLSKDGDVLDKAIAALTKENAATQVDVITKALGQLSADTSASAVKIGKSGSIGLLEISGLLSAKNQEVWKGLLTEVLRVVNQTSTDIMAKKDITKDLPEAKLATLSKAIKSQKKGIMDIVAIVPGQIPPAVKTQLDNAVAKAAANASKPATDGTTTAAPKMPKIPNLSDPEVQKKMDKAVDDLLEQVVNVVSGKQESFKLPEGVTLPPGVNLPGVAPAADAPASTSAGDMAGMPGMAAEPKAAPKTPAQGKPNTPTKQVPSVVRF